MPPTGRKRYMIGVYPCPGCGVRFAVDELDDTTGLCPYCRHEIDRPGPGRRSCPVCGKAISGRSDRQTCSTACRTALHRSRKEND